MKIVDTSNGPAIDDDGYIILPTDRAGMLHLAALEPDSVNELLNAISRYVNDGLKEFNQKVRLTAGGEVAVDFDEIEDILHTVQKANSASALMSQVSRTLLQELSRRPEPQGTVQMEMPAAFPPGYEVVVYSTNIDPNAPAPGLYYPSFDVIPQKVLDGLKSGDYALYRWAGPEEGSVEMTYDQVMAEISG